MFLETNAILLDNNAAIRTTKVVMDWIDEHSNEVGHLIWSPGFFFTKEKTNTTKNFPFLGIYNTNGYRF